MVVAKLKGARERKKRSTGRCEGRKPAPEAARMLARQRRAQGYSLREISAALAAHRYLSPSDRPYLPKSVRDMLRPLHDRPHPPQLSKGFGF
jgi:hypothetical protein